MGILHKSTLYHPQLMLSVSVQNSEARRRGKYEAYRDMLRIFLKVVARYFGGLAEMINWGWY